MKDETAEMQALTEQMRVVMAAWIKEPKNENLRRDYRTLQRRYQRLFLALKQAQVSQGAA